MDKENIYKIEKSGDELRIRFLSNELAFFGEPESSEEFIEDTINALDEETLQLILDLHELNLVNSSVLGIFVKLKKKLPEQIRYGVVGANSSIRKVMELTRLQSLLLD